MMFDQTTTHFDYSNYSPTRPEDLAPGILLGREKNYRLEKFLGAGGMGYAWLASEIEGGDELRKVVCKVLPALLQREQLEMKKVIKTFHLVQPLSHPNICPIYALKTDPEYGFFFVMGYADGGTLEDWVHEQPDYEKGLPFSQVMEVLRPVAQALDHAHEMGVIHRDVKPQNILFATRGGRKIPWLIDFGISAQIHSTMTQTLGNRGSSGTPAYMAPEQCQNMAQDGRTDQYAFGVMVYQLLSGHLPFSADNPVKLWKEIVYTPAPPLKNVSTPVNNVLQKVLAKERKDRFATCMEFMDALEDAERKGMKYCFVPSVRRCVSPVIGVLKKRKWLWLVCLLALLMLGCFVFSFSAKRPQTKPSVKAPPAASSEPSPKPKPDDEKIIHAAGDRKVLTVDGIEYAFRWCPPGEFMMGGTLYENEQPIHKVKLTHGFWLLETEVTQKMWQSVMGNNPSDFEGGQNPVDQVSWNNCQKFCQKLSEKLGQKVQLPTEAQWEYACRAGTTSDFAGDLDEMAWYGSNSDEKPHPVGLKKPNAWGLYDMHGNLCEYCLDWLGEYSDLSVNDPEGPSSGMRHVIRGGSWDAWKADYCRSEHRWGDTPDFKNNSRGLRILLTPDATDETNATAPPVKSEEPSANPKSDDEKDLTSGAAEF